jgi:hypothetical protein
MQNSYLLLGLSDRIDDADTINVSEGDTTVSCGLGIRANRELGRSDIDRHAHSVAQRIVLSRKGGQAATSALYENFRFTPQVDIGYGRRIKQCNHARSLSEVLSVSSIDGNHLAGLGVVDVKPRAHHYI